MNTNSAYFQYNVHFMSLNNRIKIYGHSITEVSIVK
jgi:hypothetical protein